MRWEYRLLRLSPGEPLWRAPGQDEVLSEMSREAIEDELNRRGREGWELVDLLDWEFALFKRLQTET